MKELDLKKLDKKKLALNAAKGLVVIIGGLGSAALARAAIKNMVPMDDLEKYNKVMIIIGSILVGGAIADVGANQAANIFDEVVTMPIEVINQIIKAMKSKEGEDPSI